MSDFRPRGGGAFGFESGGTILVLDRAAIAAFDLPGGQVFQWTRSLTREISELAQSKLLPGRGYRTGELQRSVGFSATPAGAGGVVGNVRATSSHAVYYHEGTLPHRIEPRNPNGVLKFRDFHGLGKTEFARGVNWGSRSGGFSGHPFLREAMQEVLASRGILR